MANCLPDLSFTDEGASFNNLLHQQLIASWANYRQIRHFRLVRHFRQIRHFPRGHVWHPT